MEQIQQGMAASLTNTWYDAAGNIADPGTVTVTIVRADGTVMMTGAATSGSGAVARALALTAVNTALLDKLAVTWTSSLLGTTTTYAEIVGGFWFSIADARAQKPLEDTTKYPTAKIREKRQMAERALEAELHAAYVPRYEFEELRCPSGGYLAFTWPLVRTVRSISVDGIAWTGGQLAEVTVLSHGIRLPRTWGTGVISVGYEHGFDSPGAEAPRIALRLARHYLVEGPGDDRAIRVDVDSGSYLMSTPGMRGQRFGIPEVDAFVNANVFPLVR